MGTPGEIERREKGKSELTSGGWGGVGRHRCKHCLALWVIQYLQAVNEIVQICFLMKMSAGALKVSNSFLTARKKEPFLLSCPRDQRGFLFLFHVSILLRSFRSAYPGDRHKSSGGTNEMLMCLFGLSQNCHHQPAWSHRGGGLASPLPIPQVRPGAHKWFLLPKTV